MHGLPRFIKIRFPQCIRYMATIKTFFGDLTRVFIIFKILYQMSESSRVAKDHLPTKIGPLFARPDQ